MPLRTAGRLCPQGIFLPVDGAKYGAASKQVMAVLRRFTPLVEPISIDEAFLDVTGSRRMFGDGEAIGRQIKDAVRAETGLTISVGVATTKLVAKIASDLRKPDGLVVVLPGDEAAFLAPLPISRLWGVGEKTATVLAEYGVKTIGDLADLSPDLLVRRFGKHGASLVSRAVGLDDDPVHEGDPAKSVGHETTFGMGAGHEPKLAIGNHRLAVTDAFRENRIFTGRADDFNGPQVDRVVGLHDENLCAVLADLDRRRRHDDGIAIDAGA